ncbi:hypothetical protein BLOT_004842 [Blomia tropicalis]|nr:hypothetical protein BLOT_004842 [Blomia tropicalis]
MEPLYQHSNENNSLTVERETTFQSSSAPTSPTKIPANVINLIATNQNASGDSSAESTASADELHSRAIGAFGADLGSRHKSHRSVKFPDDNAIVTGYHEAPDPYRYVADMDNDVESVSIAYKEACAKQNIIPISSVLEQIQNFKCNRMRAQDLILRGEHLDAHQCEALEAILKRVLFRLIDLDSCNLDCDGASALFDMIEFYESASHLSIANNTSIGVIGWQSLCRTLKKTACLQYLDLSNTGLNEQILLIMGRTIRVGSHLVTLHLENAGLFSRRLAILVSSIKFNTSLRELYLGENKICSADCVQLGNLLRGNAYLNVLDLRSNLIQDIGLDHICEGLSHQPSSSTVFDIFEGNRNRGSMSQNAGILILNLSDNQLSSRAMNRLAQTLSQCRSLIGIDLSNNMLGDEGVLILKEGLLQCQTLKYLNLSNTGITSEGSNAIADVINRSSNLSIIDLSNNDITQDGFMAIRDAVSDGSRPDDNIEEMVEEIDSYCDRNKSEVKYDEIDEILNGHLRSDISIYSEIDLNNINNTFNDSNNNFSYPSGDSTSPFYCDKSANDVNSDGDDSEDEQNQNGKKPILMRTASLGSWERPVKSGRFSVSPVDLTFDEAEMANTDIQINVDMISPDRDDEPMPEPFTPKMDVMEVRNYSSDDDNGSDISQTETDQLSDLPSKDIFMGMSRLMPPQQRSFRRMSSPAITVAGLVKAPKPKSNLQLKLSGNLESLDLKSSLPLSPTFFAKFDFSDLSLLRLPVEVEEIISNLPIHNSDSEELIFLFEQELTCLNKTQSETRPEQCVY